jgi:putative nucleotidyltransferase with HDIG domain
MIDAPVATPLGVPTPSIQELDVLTESFNRLMGNLVEARSETDAAYLGAIGALAAALDARDPYTAGHSERVSALSVEIGRGLALDAAALDVLRLGALLHDVGKIGISDAILGKPSPLTEVEFEAIKRHTVLGAHILRPVGFLHPHIPIVELHHERIDGAGYPHGLRGDEIPLPARIVHVADAYDAMTTARAYRAGLPAEEALAELTVNVGTDFDAAAVEALARAVRRLRRAA